MTASLRLPEAIETIPDALTFWAEQAPDSPAFIVPGESVITYADLCRGAMMFAAAIGRAGFSREDRIVVLVSEGPALATSLLGTMSAAVAVPVDLALTAPELSIALDGLSAAGAVVSQAVSTAARDCLNRHRLATIDLDVDVVPSGSPGVDQVASLRPVTWPQAEDLAFVTQTSGTTGRPKRIPKAHERILWNSRLHRDRFGLDQDDRALAVAPMTLALGHTVLFHGIAAGSALIFPTSPALVDVWAAIEAERPTWMHTSAGFLELLASWLRGNPARPAPASLRFVRVTAASISTDVCDELAIRLDAPILPSYSTSETGIIATTLPPPSAYKSGSTGRLMQDVRLVADDVDVARGEEGEIWVRGPKVLSGYLDDPELNAVAFTADGWLRTGDVGYLDDEGFLFLTGRLKELINRGGTKISPAEVDAVLLAHPAVQAAAAFAVPDERMGEDLVAAVVAADGARPTPRELRAWMLDRLAPHKAPRRIWFVDDLPRTPSGKVRRGELARRWSEEAG